LTHGWARLAMPWEMRVFVGHREDNGVELICPTADFQKSLSSPEKKNNSLYQK